MLHPPHDLRRRASAILAVWLGLVASPAGAEDCLECHGDQDFLSGMTESPERDAALFVPDSLLAGSVHDGFDCTDCHLDHEEVPHPPQAETEDCSSCHDDQADEWASSVHGAGLRGQHDAPHCADCHGLHRVLPATDRNAPTHPLNEAALCAGCHDDPGIQAVYFHDPADSLARRAVSTYQEAVHGLAVSRSGLIISATCSDCHGAHAIFPADSPSASVHRDNVTQTCGTCHVGVLERWEESSHGRAFREAESDPDGRKAPVCTSCHASHGVVAVDAGWTAEVVEECGACHDEQYGTYFDTYHGKVTRLGGPLVARCSDCHTPHSNLPADDPGSTVHPDRLIETCSRCHEKASAGFVLYEPHPDKHDRVGQPALFWTWTSMSTLLMGVFAFFGTHSVLWLVRGFFPERREEDDEGEEDGR